MISATNKKTKPGLVRVLDIDAIRPSPENERLYRPVSPEDPEVQDLSASIQEHGIQEPLLVSKDYWIISGHRRHVAAQLAGLEQVPCRIASISRADDSDAFLVKLRECNRQAWLDELEDAIARGAKQ